jgi:hypothetical protein
MPGAKPRRLDGPIRRSAALGLGVTDGALRGPGWFSPLRGVHQPAPSDRGTALARLRTAAAVLPSDGAVGGWAAALLLGAPYVDDVGLDGRRRPVLLCVPRERRVRPRPGIEWLRAPLPRAELVEARGLPVTNAARTGFDLARRLDRDEAVAILDQMLRSRLLHEMELRSLIASRRGWDGVPRARAIVELLDPGAESPRESQFRLLWRDAGLPTPSVNLPVYDARTGCFLARPDLADLDVGLLGEYDGADHAGAARRFADHAREQRLRAAGFEIVRAFAVDFSDAARRAELQDRLRATYQQRLQRDRSRDGWAGAERRAS